MTVRLKLALILGALVCANASIWGVRQLLAGYLDHAFKAIGG